MKIGILTFHSVDNFGAVLQTYALQTYLSSQGHEVEIIDYRPPYFHSKQPLSLRPDRLLGRLVASYVSRLFEHWRKQCLNRSKPCFSTSDLERHLPHYDVVVVGSDQVWSPDVDRRKETDPVFYFRWNLPDGTRKIAYAASFGTDEIQERHRSDVIEGLKNIDVISVREESGVRIVKELSGRKAVWVCDPVFLLTPDQWRAAAGVTSRVRKEFFSYMGPPLAMLADIAKSLSVKIVSPGWIPRILVTSGLRMAWFGPFDWIRRVAESRAVITKSFHGTAFCVLMHAPFVYLMPSGAAAARSTRVLSLLMRLGLEDRIVRESELTPTLLAKKISESIDWVNADKLRNEYVKVSTDYLKKEVR